MRAKRPRYGDLSEEQKKRSRCRAYTHVLLKRGKLQKQPCARCGSEKSQAHHPDYSDPRTVVWLCVDCHRETHGIDFAAHLPLFPREPPPAPEGV